MAKAWQEVKEQNLREFNEIHAAMLQRERESGQVVLHGGTPQGTPKGTPEKEKSNGKGKGKEKQ